MNDDMFWLVWCPTHRASPTFRHPSYDAAKREAMRLAQAHQGSEFYVVRAESRAVYQTVTVTTLCERDEDIPF